VPGSWALRAHRAGVDRPVAAQARLPAAGMIGSHRPGTGNGVARDDLMGTMPGATAVADAGHDPGGAHRFDEPLAR